MLSSSSSLGLWKMDFFGSKLQTQYLCWKTDDPQFKMHPWKKDAISWHKKSNKGENIHEQHIFFQVHKMKKKRSSSIMWLLNFFIANVALVNQEL